MARRTICRQEAAPSNSKLPFTLLFESTGRSAFCFAVWELPDSPNPVLEGAKTDTEYICRPSPVIIGVL